MFDFLKNTFLNRGRYKTHSEAVIVSCFYNPQNNPYRLLAFQKWYHSVKHLNHRIIECMIGDSKQQLPENDNIIHIRTESLLWHKESLLNKVIADLPSSYKYVFWLDADVLFTNQNWLVDSVETLQKVCILQPFEYCIHLSRNKLKPDFDVETYRLFVNDMSKRHPMMWKSFCANHVTDYSSGDKNYNRHGHVGFAWGAQRKVLEKCNLYDKALIGGSDHILAHAAAGQIPHDCISNSFTDNLIEVLQWSAEFHRATHGQIGYVPGDLYHIWHGDIGKRQYLQRIKDFTRETKEITQRDANGLYIKPGCNVYMKRHYMQREVSEIYFDDFEGFDDGFYGDMGYLISDVFDLFGAPRYDSDCDSEVSMSTYSQPDEHGGNPFS